MNHRRLTRATMTDLPAPMDGPAPVVRPTIRFKPKTPPNVARLHAQPRFFELSAIAEPADNMPIHSAAES
jgi:hypothetical protein